MRLLLIVAPGKLHLPGTLSRPDPRSFGVPAAPLAVQSHKMVRSCAIQPDDLPEESEADSFESAPSRRFDSWRRRSAVGAIATGVALGLKEVFQPGKIEPVITAEAPGDPPDADERVRVILDHDDPTKSVAIVPPAWGSRPSVDPPG
jgi:hypothetical protein